jgi:recombination protein RecR
MKPLASLEALANSFSKLPGVGIKSAERMAYATLGMKEEDREEFIKSLSDVGTRIHSCPICGLYTESDKCEICSDPSRDQTSLCVIASAKDAYAIERTGSFHGLYHVLGGLLSASKGIGANDIKIDELISRVKDKKIKEVIIATNPTLDGETTALFIAKLLEGTGANVTRLGYGLPMGASLDYADSLTLSKALEGRKKI